MMILAIGVELANDMAAQRLPNKKPPGGGLSNLRGWSVITRSSSTALTSADTP
jgi:hypothetical protein